MRRSSDAEDPLRRALRSVVQVLERHDVAYALTGGLALAQHGVIRATQDVDLLLSPSQIEQGAVLNDLKSDGFAFDLEQTIQEWRQYHITQIEFQGVRIDWLDCVLPAFRDVLDTAVIRQIAGVEVRVASAEGLVLLKTIAFREQDRLDIQGLLAADAGKLDLDFVRDRLLQMFEADDPRLTWLDEAVKQFG